jgi:hypothetical protein
LLTIAASCDFVYSRLGRHRKEQSFDCSCCGCSLLFTPGCEGVGERGEIDIHRANVAITSDTPLRIPTS